MHIDGNIEAETAGKIRSVFVSYPTFGWTFKSDLCVIKQRHSNDDEKINHKWLTLALSMKMDLDLDLDI